MIKETMTSEERLLAAINLEPYDRVPVTPQMNLSFPLFAIRHKGKHTAEVYESYARGSGEEGLQIVLDLFDEVGGWDGMAWSLGYPPYPDNSSLYYLSLTSWGMSAFPGEDERLSLDSPKQFAEREAITAEDYDGIINLGWLKFMEKNAERIIGSTPPPPEVRSCLAKRRIESCIKMRDVLYNRQIPAISSISTLDPQMHLSLLRTLTQFTLELGINRYPATGAKNKATAQRESHLRVGQHH